jgi:predicted ester cyclase
VARYTWRGTHQGEFQGLSPTGRNVTVRGVGIFRIAGGKIVEEWWQEDLLGLLRQLEAIPAAGQVSVPGTDAP